MKRNLFLILSLMVLTVFGIHAVAQANISQNTNDEILIKSTINQYFTSKYDSLKSLSGVSLDSYYANDDQAVIENGKFQKDVLSLLVEWRKLRSLALSQYNVDSVFTGMNISGNEAFVSVIENASYEFTKCPGIAKSSTPHEIKLKKVGQTWKIVNDNYEDDTIKYVKLNKEKGKSIENLRTMLPQTSNNIDNLKSYSGASVQASPITPAGTGYYNRSNAVYHADLYWSRTGYGYDPNYVDFTYMGGDCTNYVSQNIRAGGATANDTTTPYTWYYLNAGGSTSDDSWSSSWNNVVPLRDYIVNNTATGTPSGYETSRTNLGLGDIIQYDLNGDGAYDHSVFVTEVYKDGLVWEQKINAHTSDRYHDLWDAVPFVYARFIRISGV